jgi:large subunit ribosomal protein L9
MKVILTAEVKGKGHEGDVVDVARGYAVNYLLPRKMAIHATPGNLKQLEARMTNIQQRNDSRRTKAEGLAGDINGKSVIIKAKAGEAGKLFGSVTALMIEEAIAAQLSADVDHKHMDLHRPIKALGDYAVSVSVYGDVKAEVVVKVVPEGAVTVESVVEAVSEPAEVEEATDEPAEVEIEEAPEADDADETTEESAE